MTTPNPVPTGNTYDKYASTNPIERRMMSGFFGALDACIDGLAPTQVLEVGTGEGEVRERLIAAFPQVAVRGIDREDEHLLAEWARRGLPASVGDVMAIDAADDAYDLVLAIEVLEHVPDPDHALREIARVCRGHVVLSVPREPIWRIGNMARGRYLKALGNTPGHINHWSARSFTRLVGRHFEIEQVHRPLPWTMVRAKVRR